MYATNAQTRQEIDERINEMREQLEKVASELDSSSENNNEGLTAEELKPFTDWLDKFWKDAVKVPTDVDLKDKRVKWYHRFGDEGLRLDPRVLKRYAFGSRNDGRTLVGYRDGKI